MCFERRPTCLLHWPPLRRRRLSRFYGLPPTRLQPPSSPSPLYNDYQSCLLPPPGRSSDDDGAPIQPHWPSICARGWRATLESVDPFYSTPTLTLSLVYSHPLHPQNHLNHHCFPRTRQETCRGVARMIFKTWTAGMVSGSRMLRSRTVHMTRYLLNLRYREP